MSTFFAALVAYFACNGMVADRLLTRDEARDCVKSYRAAKTAFTSERERKTLSDGPTSRMAALGKWFKGLRDRFSA